jgi:hypothetical protein
MGAGTTRDHYVQDAAETYMVFCLQTLATQFGVNLTTSLEEKKSLFLQYCEDRDITEEFNESIYKKNVDTAVEPFFSNLLLNYPGEKFDIVDVEKQFRSLNLKGDFVVQFERLSPKSFSLKNYKRGFDRIQLCSGTWNSFLNNFLFEADGVGILINPLTGERFKGSDRIMRDSLIEKMGYSALKKVYNKFDHISDSVRSYYVESEEADMWFNVSSQWKEDCMKHGLDAAQSVIQVLDELRTEQVKQRVISMAGLNHEEEVLLIGGGKYCCSLFNPKYREMLRRANSTQSSVKYGMRGKGIFFSLVDDGGIIADIEIPFTLQKNGAWHLPKQRYSGKRYHNKEKVSLAYGQRRPKKSREISTSVNTYLNLKKAGVL